MRYIHKYIAGRMGKTSGVTPNLEQNLLSLLSSFLSLWSVLSQTFVIIHFCLFLLLLLLYFTTLDYLSHTHSHNTAQHNTHNTTQLFKQVGIIIGSLSLSALVSLGSSFPIGVSML